IGLHTIRRSPVAPRRGIVIALSLVGLVVLAFVAAVLVLVLVSRGPSIQDSSVLVLRPAGDMYERQPDDVVGQVLGGDSQTLKSFLDSLRMAKRDSRIEHVLLLPGALQLPYWGKLQE